MMVPPILILTLVIHLLHTLMTVFLRDQRLFFVPHFLFFFLIRASKRRLSDGIVHFKEKTKCEIKQVLSSESVSLLCDEKIEMTPSHHRHTSLMSSYFLTFAF